MVILLNLFLCGYGYKIKKTCLDLMKTGFDSYIGLFRQLRWRKRPIKAALAGAGHIKRVCSFEKNCVAFFSKLQNVKKAARAGTCHKNVYCSVRKIAKQFF
jgi:hypothetical protein